MSAKHQLSDKIPVMNDSTLSRRDTLKAAVAASMGSFAASRALSADQAGAGEADDPAARMALYNPVWETQSRNALESMPCGAGDIGLNVWVEDGDLLIYVARSGAFDESNAYLKLGRIRVHLDPSPFTPGAQFRQELSLVDGEILITGHDQGRAVRIAVWVDVESPVAHIEVDSDQPVAMLATLECWRAADRDYVNAEGPMHTSWIGAPRTPRQYRDETEFGLGGVLTFHRNRDKDTVFDLLVEQQKLDAVKAKLWNPLKGLAFGMVMRGEGLSPAGSVAGRYASTDHVGWRLRGAPNKRHDIRLYCHVAQTDTHEDWLGDMRTLIAKDRRTSPAISRKRSRQWWKEYWERSYIVIQPGAAQPESAGWRVGRNYQLFRHQLGTNARAAWPTKFNGGNFSVDPEYVTPDLKLSPDYRAWGGGAFTAQNQRLVYWPMLKSGDVDMMEPQFAFYRNARGNAELRSQVYWGHGGACFSEQIENFGLPVGREWGWRRDTSFGYAAFPGVESNAWVSYQWDTALEFCFMILQAYRYAERPLGRDLSLIDSCLTFFDAHYRQEYKKISGSELDTNGKLVLFPGTALETYKNALNSCVTIAALDAVLRALLALPEKQVAVEQRRRYAAMLKTVPPLPIRLSQGRRTLAPAQLWDRIQNTEIPQLYPVFPYGQYGVGKPDIDVAIDTWKYGVDTPKQKNFISWHQDAIFCARLGLADEAKQITIQKLDDSGRRYPTFWGPGHDWVPDHNWGGSGMVGLQDMAIQAVDEKIYLFPAWPKDWDVDIRLHAPGSTIVEASLRGGTMTRLAVEPSSEAARVVLPDWLKAAPV